MRRALARLYRKSIGTHRSVPMLFAVFPSRRGAPARVFMRSGPLSPMPGSRSCHGASGAGRPGSAQPPAPCSPAAPSGTEKRGARRMRTPRLCILDETRQGRLSTPRPRRSYAWRACRTRGTRRRYAPAAGAYTGRTYLPAPSWPARRPDRRTTWS